MTRTVRRAALPCMVLLCLAADHPPAAQAGPPDAPATMQGFLRYRVRGLSAVQGGLLAGGIMSVATGVGMQSAATNAIRLVTGLAKVSGNPSTGQLETFLRTGKGFDFSGAPVSAGGGVDLDFVLETDGKGNWRLKSGNARYSGKTDAEFSHQNADGFVRITDRYSGEGSVKLTPENASITLTTTGKGNDRQVEFDVAVSFPVYAVGKSNLTTNVYEIFFQDNGQVFKSGLNFLGQQHSDQTPSTPITAGVNYNRSGPPDSVLRGRETWQDLRDSGVLIEWELWDRCGARIETPEEYDELVYDRSTTGRIERAVKADVQPSFWSGDLHWKFMPMSGSDIQPTPDRANGSDFDLSYTKLPPKNSSFGDWLLKAEFATERARKAGCKDPKPHEIAYLFPREADNNPGPSARAPGAGGSGPDPNWFFYWRQTQAALGRGDGTFYGAERAEHCVTPGVGGYAPGAGAFAPIVRPHIVVCDLARPGWQFNFSHPWTDYYTQGIDTYAAVVVHEWRHVDDYRKWWPKGRSAALDRDDDLIPDALESSTAVPPPLNDSIKFFSDSMYDTLGKGFNDAHYMAYMAMTEWAVGSADHQDWSCPGVHATKECSQ